MVFMGTKKKDKNSLKLKIKFEGFSLEVFSDEPNKTLFELNNMIRSKKELVDSMLSSHNPIDIYDYLEDDDFGIDVNMRRFTKELISNKESSDAIRNLFLKHKNFIYRKERIDAKQEIDFTNKRLSMIIEKKDINILIKALLFDVNLSKLKHILVHIISDDFDKEHQGMFLDELKKRASFAETTFFFTPKKLNGVVLAEALFFGDFPPKEEE